MTVIEKSLLAGKWEGHYIGSSTRRPMVLVIHTNPEISGDVTYQSAPNFGSGTKPIFNVVLEGRKFTFSATGDDGTDVINFLEVGPTGKVLKGYLTYRSGQLDVWVEKVE